MDLYCISEPIFDESMIDTLVMPDERRNLIKALAQPYRQKGDPNNPSTFKPWTADFVASKGEGKIFLLHGRPGVGKTYTAGSIQTPSNDTILYADNRRMYCGVYKTTSSFTHYERYWYQSCRSGSKSR